MKAFMVVTFVVTFFSCVSAEGTCAWILWSNEKQISDNRFNTWMPSAYDTKQECEERIKGFWFAQFRVYEKNCGSPIPVQCKTYPKDTDKYKAACTNIVCKNGGALDLIFASSLMQHSPSYLRSSNFTCLPDTIDPRTNER